MHPERVCYNTKQRGGVETFERRGAIVIVLFFISELISYGMKYSFSSICVSCPSPKIWSLYLLVLPFPNVVMPKITHCLYLHLQCPTAGSNFM